MNRKEYEERIAKIEKELDELKEVDIVDDEFPKYGEYYWFVDSVGNVFGDCWYDSMADNYRKDFLRIFKTKKECKRYLEIQKAFKEESKNFESNWKDGNQDKYYLYYDHSDNCVEVDSYVECQETILYFESEEVLEEIVSCFGEEDIKKYYFGIEG